MTSILLLSVARRAARVAVSLGALAACLIAAPAHAVWNADGTVVCNAASLQQEPQMTPDGLGGFYMVWNDQRGGCCGRIYLQRVQSDGTVAAGWPVNGIAVTTSTLTQQNPQVTTDGSGGAIVAWSQFYAAGDRDIHVQRVTSSGSIFAGWPATGAIACFAGGVQDQPVLVPDMAHGAFVAWRDVRSGTNADVYVQHVLGSGALAGGWFPNGNPVCTAAGDQNEVAIVSDGFNNAFIAWTDRRGADADIYGQYVDAGGAMGWNPDGSVLCGASGDQTRARLAPDGSLGMLAVWNDRRTFYDVYGLRARLAGIVPGWAVNGTAIVTEADVQLDPDVVSDGTGGMIVAWLDRRNFGSDYDVYAQHLQGDATLAAGWVANGLRICSNPSSQYNLDLAADGAGGAIAAWEDGRNGGMTSPDVYGQHVTGAGQLAWPSNGQRICGLAATQMLPRVIPDGVGGAFVGWQDERPGGPTLSDIYAMRLTGLSNLNATITPAGFSSPVVPRNAPGATLGNAVLTPTLDGNANTTWLNWAVQHEGPYNLPAWGMRVYLDEETWVGVGGVGDDNWPGSWQAIDVGTLAIRGGRHSLVDFADYDATVPESNEFDNTWGGQWVWSPLPVTSGNPVVRAIPPQPGYFWIPNSDGLQYTHESNFAWVTGLAPLDPSSDYDLNLYDDYSGSLSGFSNQIGVSGQFGSQTDFVVGHFTGTPNTVYPAMIRMSLGGGDYSADQISSSGRLGFDDARFLNQVMPANRFVDVFEAYLAPGVVHSFGLDRTAGTADLAFEIFPSTSGGIYGRGHPLSRVSTPMTANEDTLSFVSPGGDWHPIVVYRTRGTEAGTPVTYNFMWGFNRIVGIEDGEDRPTELSFAGAVPNPVHGRSQMAFALPQAAHVRLELYDIGGRRVRTLADREYPAGRHALSWGAADGSGPALSAGVYWARMDAGGRAFTRRVVVMD